MVLVAAVCISAMATSTARANEDLPPVITYFSWYNPMGNYFIFYGTITDENPESCIIAFSGVLNGYYTSVDYDGYFYVVAELVEGTIGDVDAVAIDNNFQNSQPAGTWVFF